MSDSCRSRAGTTSSSGSVTPSRRPTTTSTRFGFTPERLRGARDGGPRPGVVRPRAGRDPLVLTSALTDEHEVARFACTHGDGVRDIALPGPDAEAGLSRSRSSAARAVSASREWLEDEHGRVAGRVDRDLRRGRAHVRRARRLRRAVPARLHGGGAGWRADRGVGLDAARPLRRQRRAREDGRVGRVLRARARVREHRPLRRRADPHRVLGADVEGDGGRRGEDQVPDQRAGRGPPKESDRGVPRVQRRAGRTTRRDPDRRHRADGRGDRRSAASLPARHRRRTTRMPSTASARSRSRGPTCGGCGILVDRDEDGYLLQIFTKPRRTGRRCSSR